MPGTINSKAEYYALARRHLLGNTIQQWTWREFQKMMIDSGIYDFTVPHTVAMRGMTTASKQIQGYDFDAVTAFRRGLAAICNGMNHGDILVDEQAPDHLSTLKGEVMRNQFYLYMRYDQTPGLRMRAAYPTMKHMEGLRAVHLLKQHMDAPSWDMLNDLFDRYPDAMIEFSCYSRPVGHFKLNTIFWEVRTGY